MESATEGTHVVVTADSDHFLILPGAFPYVAHPEAWRTYRAAHKAWMIAAQDIDALTRADIFRENPHPRYTVPVRRSANFPVMFNRNAAPPWHELTGLHKPWATSGEFKVALTAPQRAACEDFYFALGGIFESAARRAFELGEVVAAYRFDLTEPWRRVDWEAMRDRDFIIADAVATASPTRRWTASRGRIKLHDGWVDCRVMLRGGGITLDQAMYAYAEDGAQAAELETLDRIGAPDLIGRLMQLDAGGWYRRACERWRVLHEALARRLLERLGAAELFATEAGVLVPPSYWRGMDTASASESWRPDALVWGKAPEGADTDGKKPRGRPTMRPQIEAEFERRYPDAAAFRKADKTKAAIGRELKAWAEEHLKGSGLGDVPDEGTIALWFKDYKWKAIKADDR
jgi:hypothetical protein